MSSTSRKTIVQSFIRILVIGGLIGLVIGYFDPIGRYNQIQWQALWQEAREISRTGTLLEQRDAYERVAEFARTRLGDNSEEHAVGLRFLSLTLIGLGDIEGAGVLWRRVVDIDRALHGEESARLASSKVALGGVKLRLRKLAEAEALFLEGIRVLANDEESESRLTAAFDGLARVYSETGRFGKATALREYLVSWRSNPDPALSSEAWRNLASAYSAEGKYALAEQAIDEALAATQENRTIPTSISTRHLELLGELSLRIGRLEDAAKYFSLLAARSVEKPSADRQLQLYAISSWATALIEKREIDLALASLGEIDPSNIVLRTALDRSRAGYYYATKARATTLHGDAGAAVYLISVARELMSDPDEQERGGWELESVLNLAAAYRAIGQLDEAVALLSAYLDDAEVIQSMTSPKSLARVSSELAALYATTENLACSEEMNARARAYDSAHEALQHSARRTTWRWEDIERMLWP